MHDLKGHIQEYFKKYQSSELVVACSGGVDSMVLLWLAKEYHSNIHVAHLNYQLRGEDSDKDEEHVREFCSKNKLKLYVRKVNLKKILDTEKGNLQDLARKTRYAFFNELTEGKNAFVALGQHSDDQVETFFLNLARGGGIAGLSAIHMEKGKFIRPLLAFSREEIMSFAKNNAIDWREDKSNADSKYNRNKLRNIILPEIYQRFPDLKEKVLILVQAFQKTQRELEYKIKPIVNFILANNTLTLTEYDKLEEVESLELLRQLEIPLSYHEEIQKLRKSGKGKFIPLENLKFDKIIREVDHFYFSDGKHHSKKVSLIKEEVTSLPETFTKNEIFVDPSKIQGELILRKWQIGDRISPIGLKGSKLISDILTDAKIPNHVRSKQLVVCDSEKIVWCPGFSVSRLALATEDTKKIKLSLSFG